ncbi:hypothetical protein CRG98_012401 [Punica granatum]|uniref:Uncharacterized protein n=1 Tax=Punica granatum TaxID=22663 RepID=A0A2I0KFC3_PUNGR|nr:hypothetical protein CRG98_012401 [Punica granatum]
MEGIIENPLDPSSRKQQITSSTWNGTICLCRRPRHATTHPSPPLPSLILYALYCFPDFASALPLSGLRVRFTAFRTSRPFYCFRDFASALPLSGLRVRFTAFRTLRPRTSRPLYCFPDFASTDFASTDFASPLPLSELRVRFTAFRTSRSLYRFPDFVSALPLSGLRSTDFVSALLLSGLRFRFTAFRTSRPRTSRSLYCFPDFASVLLLFGLRVRFTAFRTSRPLYRFPDFASTLLLSGLSVRFTAFRTSRPFYRLPDFASTLLLSGLRVHGLLIHFTSFRGLRPFTYHFTSSKSHSCYYLMTGGASYHGDRRQKRSPGPKKGASHGLWLHSLTEHATKEGQAAPRDHQGHGTNFRRPFGTLRGSPRDVSEIANAPDEPSGHIREEQRPQRFPNTSRHSGNTEKIPVTSPWASPGQRSSAGDDEPMIPTGQKGHRNEC